LAIPIPIRLPICSRSPFEKLQHSGLAGMAGDA
jgi:hypothetical protein